MSATLTPLRRERARALLEQRGAPESADASASRVVATLARAAWAQAVLRATAAASNLSVAHTRVAVIGSGPLARELATTTAAMGARVVVVGETRSSSSSSRRPVSPSPSGVGHGSTTPSSPSRPASSTRPSARSSSAPEARCSSSTRRRRRPP
ncbi:hypothetical protein [Rathayibacter tanaceti]|nr:hypothetical protein [Rathayibacter tanaceti]